MNQYHTDVVLPPGETLRELLEEHSMSTVSLAKHTGLTQSEIEGVLSASISINDEIATRIERALGVPARFWLELESNYQSFLKESFNSSKR